MPEDVYALETLIWYFRGTTGKKVSLHYMTTYKKSRHTAPFILNLGTCTGE